MTIIKKQTLTTSTEFKNLFNGRQEVYKLAEDLCVNKQDAVLLILLYEGMELSEISNLKVTDCDFKGNIISASTATDESRSILLEQRAMDIVSEAISETEYENNNGRVGTGIQVKSYPVIPADYVVKNIQKGSKIIASDAKVSVKEIIKRLEAMMCWFEKPIKLKNNQREEL